MTTEELFEELRNHIDTLNARTVVSDGLLAHFKEVYTLTFIQWYDSDNEATRKFANEIWPHLAAINDELKFRR